MVLNQHRSQELTSRQERRCEHTQERGERTRYHLFVFSAMNRGLRDLDAPFALSSARQ